MIRLQRKEVDQVAMLINPTRTRTGPNYERLNFENLKKKQRENRKQREEEKPAPVPFKIKRFAHVESVVYKSPSDAKLKKEHKAPSIQHSIDESAGRNYVLSNAVAAITAQPKRQAPFIRPDARALNPSYGKVPKYLQNIKSELVNRKEDIERRAELAKVPYGMRLIPEEERVETLASLQKKKTEVYTALSKLPITSTTPSMIRRKNDYEKQLTDLESAISTFSRKRVFLQID